MVDLTKMGNVRFKVDEKSKLMGQIGLNVGMTMGMSATFVAIMLAQMQLWLKIFSGLGVFCAIIMMFGGVLRSTQQLKAYKAAMAEFEKINKPADDSDASKTTGYVG